MKNWFTALAFIFAQAGISSAATMTFDNYDFGTASLSEKTYSEDGINVAGNGSIFESFGRGGGNSLYLADGGWGGPTALTFTMASAFNALSFDLTPSLFSYIVTNTLTGKSAPGKFANVQIKGFNELGLATTKTLNMGEVLETRTITLGNAFRNLTSLVIGFRPTAGFLVPTQLTEKTVGICTDVPCSRFRVDNVTLAPVPLPATLSLSLAALAAMSFVSRRRRANQLA